MDQTEKIRKTSERLMPDRIESGTGQLMYLRHLFAYYQAGEIIGPGGRVLEIGCGEGYGTDYLSGLAEEIIGLDIAEEIIARAGRKYRAANCRFMAYDGHKLPFADNSFTAVVSFQVIEHIRDSRQMIAEARRVLREGGKFILTTPNRANRLPGGEKPFNKFHVREYAAAELEEALKADFPVYRIYGVRAIDEIEELEKQRTRRIRRLVALDPFDLRSRMPEAILSPLRRLMKLSKGEKGPIAEYALSDFHISDSDLDNSLDLMAVCRK